TPLPVPALGESRGHGTMAAIATHEHHITDFSVLNPLVKFLKMAGVARHEADADFEILLGSLLREIKHPARSRPIRRHWFLHEHIELLLNRILEMHPAKSQRRGEDGRRRDAGNQWRACSHRSR